MYSLDEFIEDLIKKNETVLVAYSGGKDSTYVLKYLSDRGVNVIAYLIDNSFLSAVTIENAINVSKSLNNRLIIDVLPIKDIRGNFKKALDGDIFSKSQKSRASDICNTCMFYINRSIIDYALQNKIKYISGGYLQGQVPTSSFISKIPLKAYYETSKEFEKNLSFDNKTDEQLYDGFIYSFNPMIHLKVKETEVVEVIKELGWVYPIDSGINSSNCTINDYAIKKHIEKYGIHPYELEIKEQIKNNTIKAETAEKRLNYDYTKIQDIIL